MSNNLIIYHEVKLSVPCRDGLVGTWVASLALEDCDFLGRTYRQNEENNYPDVSSYKDVFLIDFHVPKTILELWHSQDVVVHVIDHHETTLSEVGAFADILLNKFRFDIRECGATLAWKYFFGNQPEPFFLRYILDRDCWYKMLPDTEIIHSAFGKLLYKGSLEGSFRFLNTISRMSESEFFDFMLEIGTANLEKRKEKISKIIENRIKKGALRWVEIEGYRVPMISLLVSHEVYRSDIAEWMYNTFDSEFVAVEKASGGISLRSKKNLEQFELWYTKRYPDSEINKEGRNLWGSDFNLLELSGMEGHRNAGSSNKLEYRVLGEIQYEA
jgi:oligoribonuclease NrnB/cAMP/cGMP phosphodiesterase (DHH superfamily)